MLHFRGFKLTTGVAVLFLFISTLLALTLSGCAQTQEFYVKRGDEFLKKGDYAAAIVEYKMALETGKPNHRHYQAIAESQARLGATDDAIDSLLQAADVLKKDALEISDEARRTRNDPAEQERLLYLLEERINPIHSQIYMHLGMLYVEKEDHATAVVAMKLALDRDEKNLRARMELAQLMERKGDDESALKEWRQFLKDTDKASREEKSLYGIGKAEMALARRRFEALMLKLSGARKPEKEEK